MTETVRYEVAGPVATITLNRPDRLNAMTTELLEGVLGRLEQVAADEAVRVVVLTGAGRGFCAGGDLAQTSDFAGPGSEAEAVAELRRLHETTILLHEMPKPTIAAVNGPCAGAGLSWACACDLRIAAESAVFRTAFLSAGLTGDFGGTWSLPRLVGAARARQLYLLNEKIDAATAAGIGLVGEVVPDGDLAGRVAAVADGLARAPASVIAGIKQNLNEALETGLRATLDAEAARQVAAALRLSAGLSAGPSSAPRS
jgi:2-(1,2-epoxy-1,2-dihydrophenyl)acetyl-CoA isomerase